MPGSRARSGQRARGRRALPVQPAPLAIEGEDDASPACAWSKPGWAKPDARGRQPPVPIEGSESLLEADIVIIAFGFSPTVPEWLAAQGVEGSPNGRIVAGGRRPMEASACRSRPPIPKLFAGGDAVRGADLVVTAVAEGRDAADSIAQLLCPQRRPALGAAARRHP